MKILYFGDPAGGLALLERDLDVVGVVHGRAGGVGWRRFFPLVRSMPRWRLPDLTDPKILTALAELEPELLVASFYPQRIPQSVLDLAPGINVHPSALPRWRGPDPCTWTIREGDVETAISVHWLTSGLDEGDLIQQWPQPVKPRDTTGRLAARLEALGAEKNAEIAARIVAGEAVGRQPQAGPVSWAPQIDPDDWEIDWSRTAAEVDAWVRAASPEPGAYSGFGDELLIVLDARPVDAGVFSQLEPGTPYVSQERLHIRCGDGALKLLRVQLGRRLVVGHDLVRLFI